MQNIEKSKFRKGEYVGYSDSGLWRVRRSTSRPVLWVAECRDYIRDSVYARTLKEMSDKLTQTERKGT